MLKINEEEKGFGCNWGFTQYCGELKWMVIYQFFPLNLEPFICECEKYIVLPPLPSHTKHSVLWPLPVLPSRSALPDLGLIADLFEKMPLNWSSFCLKSLLFGLKSPKSLIFTACGLIYKAKKYSKVSKIMEYFLIKVDVLNVIIKFLEQVWFGHQISKFRSAFGLIFGRNMVW